MESVKPRPESKVRPSDYKSQHTVAALKGISLFPSPHYITLHRTHRITRNYGSQNPPDPSRFLLPGCNALPSPFGPLRVANWELKSTVGR